jgi:hypothetical protein
MAADALLKELSADELPSRVPSEDIRNEADVAAGAQRREAACRVGAEED